MLVGLLDWLPQMTRRGQRESHYSIRNTMAYQNQKQWVFGENQKQTAFHYSIYQLWVHPSNKTFSHLSLEVSSCSDSFSDICPRFLPPHHLQWRWGNFVWCTHSTEVLQWKLYPGYKGQIPCCEQCLLELRFTEEIQCAVKTLIRHAIYAHEHNLICLFHNRFISYHLTFWIGLVL